MGVGGPTFATGEDNRMGTVVDRVRDRQRELRDDVVVGQGAWMMACRCESGVGREGSGVVVVVAAGVNKLAVGSSSARSDAEA